jgi:Tfp pilus assembly protein PilV
MKQADMDLRATTPAGTRALKARNAHGAAGFTLIETAIALAVMMVAALAITSLFLYSINYNSGAGARALALAIAQQRLERLRRTRLDDAALSTPTLTETVTSAGQTFTVVTNVCAAAACGGSPTLKLLTVQVRPQGGTGQWVRTNVSVMSQRAEATPGPYLR